MKKPIHLIQTALTLSTRWMTAIAPVVNVGVRFYLARIFFLSGYAKVVSMSSTIMLFKYEYNVPLLPPEFAAYTGTISELVIPVFVAAGLGARLPFIALFAFNLVAAYSYPYLWTDAGWCAMKDHVTWGLLCLFLCVYGAGKWSLDYFLTRQTT